MEQLHIIGKDRMVVFIWYYTGVNTNTLSIINLTPQDTGNYRCVATNDSGSSESNYAILTITNS